MVSAKYSYANQKSRISGIKTRNASILLYYHLLDASVLLYMAPEQVA